jgi:hypothetical protein
LTISNTDFNGNIADCGGALTRHGNIANNIVSILTNVHFTDNQSLTKVNYYGSGAIYFGEFSLETLLIRDSFFSGNSAANGAGILACNGNVVLRNSQFEGNITEPAGRGEVFSKMPNATVTLEFADKLGDVRLKETFGKGSSMHFNEAELEALWDQFDDILNDPIDG